MRLRAKWLVVFGVIMASLGWGLWHGTVVGEALDASPDDVIKSAPQGLKVKADTYFNLPQKIGPQDSISNSATFKTSATGDAVALTQDGSANQGGAIWTSKPVFDAYQNQQASMWFYIGTSGTTPGDGMAFVLNKNSNTAFSGLGESLGVWGVDPRTVNGTVQDLADTAIPNSWALEFDTGVDQVLPANNWIVNQTTPDSFDVGRMTEAGDPPTKQFLGSGYNPGSDNDNVDETIKGEHIASGYLGQSSSYLAYQQTGRYYAGTTGVFIKQPKYNYGTYNYYGLVHHGLVRDQFGDRFMSDAKWHHLTLNYQAPTDDSNTGTLTYSFNDRNLTTGAPQKMDSGTFAKEKINLSSLGVSRGDSKLYWGLTGTTGATDTETSMVAFEQVPGQVDASASSALTDETTHSAITSTNPTTSVNGNDKIKATYTLNYLGGGANWTGIKGKLGLPTNVNWTSGRISYPDGSITPLALTTQSDNQLAVDVRDLGNKDDLPKQAVITLEGTATNQDVKSPAAVASFVGDNAITKTVTPEFDIKASPFTVAVTPTTAANANTTGTVTGSISSTDKLVNGQDTTLKAVLTAPDGTTTDIASDNVKLDTTANTNSGYDFKVTIPKVPVGTSTLQVSATAQTAGNTYQGSGTGKVTGGTMDFGSTSGDLTFDTTQLTGRAMTGIARDETDGPWKLNVDSSLVAGTSWQLTAQTDGLTSDNAPGKSLDGHLIYKDQNGGMTQLSSGNAALIASGTANGQVQTTNIAADWTANTGILLDLNSSAAVGDYSGTIDWTLSSGPQ